MLEINKIANSENNAIMNSEEFKNSSEILKLANNIANAKTVYELFWNLSDLHHAMKEEKDGNYLLIEQCGEEIWFNAGDLFDAINIIGTLVDLDPME